MATLDALGTRLSGGVTLALLSEVEACVGRTTADSLLQSLRAVKLIVKVLKTARKSASAEERLHAGCTSLLKSLKTRVTDALRPKHGGARKTKPEPRRPPPPPREAALMARLNELAAIEEREAREESVRQHVFFFELS